MGQLQLNVVLVPEVIWLIFGPKLDQGRHDATAVVADEPVFDDDVGDAQPDRLSRRDGGIHSALVLRLGAGHGQVGAELGAEALRLFVIDFLVQPGQTAAGTAAEVGWTATRIGHRD